MTLRFEFPSCVKLTSSTGATLFITWGLVWAFVVYMVMGGEEKDPTITRVQAKLLAAAVSLVWIGMLSAISFTEAWIKFGAPLVTKPVGLSVALVVFSALNKAELAHAVALACAALFLAPRADVPLPALCCIAALGVIVVLQIAVLTPALGMRARNVILHASPREIPEACAEYREAKSVRESESSHGLEIHSVYIFLEVVKLEMLIQVAVWGLGPAFTLVAQLSQ
eukprot:jgi/Mesen1/7930/ME000422S07088